MTNFQIYKIVEDKIGNDRASFRRIMKRQGFSRSEIKAMPAYKKMFLNLLTAQTTLKINIESYAVWCEGC